MKLEDLEKEVNKEILLDYITITLNDNLHYDNLVNTVDIFENKLDIITREGKHFTIIINVEGDE